MGLGTDLSEALKDGLVHECVDVASLVAGEGCGLGLSTEGGRNIQPGCHAYLAGFGAQDGCQRSLHEIGIGGHVFAFVG